MKNKLFKQILIPTIVLTVICIISAIALSATHILTTDKIAENEQAKKIEAVERAVPADDYEEKKLDGKTYYVAKNKGETIGFAFEGEAQGYGGKISVITGIDLSGKVLKVEIVSCADETPGLGQNVASEEFLNRFEGISGSAVIGENVDGWTGATISSKATASAVSDALDMFSKIAKEGA